MLQARIFSYADAHRYRLGTHYEALQVNAPRCLVQQLLQGRRDALLPRRRPIQMLTTSRTPSHGPVQDEGFKEPPLTISGNADRSITAKATTTTGRPGELFRLIGHPAQQRLLDNTVEAMRGVPLEIVKRWMAHCYKADPEYGEGLAARMDISISEPASAAAAE